MKKKEKKVTKEVNHSKSALFYLFTGFLILFIPVFHIPKALDEALMPRLLALSAFSVLMAFILFFGKNYNRFNFSVLKQRIFLVLTGYLLITLISIVFALNYKESFFDIIRTFLLVSFTGYAAIIFLNNENWQEKIPKLIIFAALFALLIGAWQYYDKVILATKDTLPDGRPINYLVYGLMFHRNEYSSALLWMLPFLIYGIYRYRRGWRILAIISVVLILVMIILLKTRAVWVGIAVSLFVISIVVIFNIRKLGLPVILRNSMAGLMIVGIVGVTVVFSIEKPKDRFSLLGRIRSITDARSRDNIHRVNIWKITTEMIKERPLTGYGAGNWRIHAAYYFDGRFKDALQLNWARPHNDYLWVFSEKGLFGIIFYLMIFGFTLYYLFMALIKSPKIENRIFALLLIGGIVSYMGVSFFNFPYERLNHQVYLALMLAGSITLYHRLSPQSDFKPGRMQFFIPLLAFSVFGVIFGYKTVHQESELKYAISAYHQGNWRSMLHYAQLGYNPLKSLDQLSNPPEYYEGMALAKLNRHQEAIVAYEKAYEQFPNNMWIINWMGQSYYQVGRYKDAIQCLEKVISIIPSLEEAHISLSATYYKLGEYQKSYDALKAIPDWESNDTIIRNMNALKRIMERDSIAQ